MNIIIGGFKVKSLVEIVAVLSSIGVIDCSVKSRELYAQKYARRFSTNWPARVIFNSYGAATSVIRPNPYEHKLNAPVIATLLGVILMLDVAVPSDILSIAPLVLDMMNG